MAIVNVSKIKYAGGSRSSVVITDTKGEIRIAPSLYLADMSVNGRALNTIKSYGYHLNTFLEILNSSQIDWRKVTQEEIDIYINIYLQDKLSLTENSLIPHIAAISGFYKFAWDYGFTEYPKVFKFNLDTKSKTTNGLKTLNTSFLIKKYIEDEKFHSLVGSVNEVSDYVQERDELILFIGWYMGLRANEVVDVNNLRLSKLKDVNGNVRSNIQIVGKGSKVRTVNIPFGLQQKINRFMNGRRLDVTGDLLICSNDGSELHRAFASKVFKKASRNSGDEYFSKRTFHSLRHTFATNLVILCYENEFDPWVVVPQEMGHADIYTTFGYIYFEAVLNKRHSILKKLSVQSAQINGRDRHRKKRN